MKNSLAIFQNLRAQFFFFFICNFPRKNFHKRDFVLLRKGKERTTSEAEEDENTELVRF